MMRISAIPEDPGYANFAGHSSARILLNGVEQEHVFTADECEGWIEKAKTDDDGQIVVAGDEIVVERMTGKVEIITDR